MLLFHAEMFKMHEIKERSKVAEQALQKTMQDQANRLKKLQSDLILFTKLDTNKNGKLEASDVTGVLGAAGRTLHRLKKSKNDLENTKKANAKAAKDCLNTSSKKAKVKAAKDCVSTGKACKEKLKSANRAKPSKSGNELKSHLERCVKCTQSCEAKNLAIPPLEKKIVDLRRQYQRDVKYANKGGNPCAL